MKWSRPPSPSASTDPRDASGGKARADPRWTLVTCILASSLSFVDGSVTNVALPAIRDSYGAGAQQVQWVVNAYLLPSQPCCCSGERSAIISGDGGCWCWGPALFGVSSLVCALAPSLPLLLAARAAQGVGAALLLPNSLALLNAAFSGEKRGRAVGIWASAGAAAAAVAPLIGGWLVGTVGWPAIFYINLPLAAGAILLACASSGESREPGAGRTDYAGAALATLGLGGLTYALTAWSATRQFTGAAVLALAVGAALLGAFLWVEYRRGARAMMPLGLFVSRCFSGLNLLTFLLYGAFGAAMLLIPYVLITSGGYSPVRAGLAMLPLPILMTALSPTMGSLAAPHRPAIAADGRAAGRRGRPVPRRARRAGQPLLDRNIPDDPDLGGRHDHCRRAAHLLGARLRPGTACRRWHRGSTAPLREPED